jgi:hypothetical protein
VKTLINNQQQAPITCWYKFWDHDIQCFESEASEHVNDVLGNVFTENMKSANDPGEVEQCRYFGVILELWNNMAQNRGQILPFILWLGLVCSRAVESCFDPINTSIVVVGRCSAPPRGNVFL